MVLCRTSPVPPLPPSLPPHAQPTRSAHLFRWCRAELAQPLPCSAAGLGLPRPNSHPPPSPAIPAPISFFFLGGGRRRPAMHRLHRSAHRGSSERQSNLRSSSRAACHMTSCKAAAWCRTRTARSPPTALGAAHYRDFRIRCVQRPIAEGHVFSSWCIAHGA